MLDTKYIQSLKNVLFSKLIHLDIVKHGLFTLKNGSHSTIYMDLRQLVNYPQFFKYISKLLFLQYPHLLETLTRNAKLIPVPLGGLPFGFHLAAEHNIPLLMIRDKVKDHGMKRMIEGVIEADDEYYIIEDVITSGKSINEALDLISPVLANRHSTTNTNNTDNTNTNTNVNTNTNKPKYSGIICICNRGGMETMRDGIPIYSIFNLSELEDYIKYTPTTSPISTPISTPVSTPISLHTNKSQFLNPTPIAPIVPLGGINYFHKTTPFANELYSLALRKRSNLIISCDFMTNREIIDLLKIIGNFVIAVKLHIDMLESTSYVAFIEELLHLKSTMNFLVIEDAKFADIDAIMMEKINHSMMDIKTLADAVTIHGISGLSILEGEKLVISGIVVAEMSSANNMISSNYSSSIVDFIRKDRKNNELNLGGLVCQSIIPKTIEPFEMLTMSPGININVLKDDQNQQYSIPNLRSNRLGLFWIVGRGITNYKKQQQSEKIIEITQQYQSLGWDYFIKY